MSTRRIARLVPAALGGTYTRPVTLTTLTLTAPTCCPGCWRTMPAGTVAIHADGAGVSYHDAACRAAAVAS